MPDHKNKKTSPCKTEPKGKTPIQDLICRKEHEELFKELGIVPTQPKQSKDPYECKENRSS